MQNDEKTRERRSELYEIHYGFQEQGKRLSDCLDRLSIIGNKLADESDCSSPDKPENPTSKLPGITTDLNNCVDGFKEYISRIEMQLTKIEKHI